MLPGCGKKHNNLSAGSPFEVVHIYMSSIINYYVLSFCCKIMTKVFAILFEPFWYLLSVCLHISMTFSSMSLDF